jgi:hypothetical protein
VGHKVQASGFAPRLAADPCSAGRLARRRPSRSCSDPALTKIKLDENLPVDLAPDLMKLGHVRAYAPRRRSFTRGAQRRPESDRAHLLDIETQTHQYSSMRTTIDLPDDLYRALKARAGLTGVTSRQLVQRLIQQGLSSSTGGTGARKRYGPPPVIIPRRRVRIPAVSRAELMRIDEEEDEAKHA